MATSRERSYSLRELLIVAVWFGLATGLVEGVILWGTQRLGWLGGWLIFLGSSLEIVWISAFFDLILFGFAGLVLYALALRFARLPAMRIGVFLFASMMFFDWLAIPLVGRVRIWAIPVPAVGLAVQLVRWFDQNRERARRVWRKKMLTPSLPIFGRKSQSH